jgi:putative Mn2+ efflux pump MntP
MGPISPDMKSIVALAGGALAASSHLTKAGTRAAANTSPEPFSNWILSLSEDGFVVGLALLALTYPVAAAIVVLGSLAIIVALAGWIVRSLRRRLKPRELINRTSEKY